MSMMGIEGGGESKEKVAAKKGIPRVKERSDVPLFGDMVKGIAPMEDQEMFFRYAVNRPRLVAILSKAELTQRDKEELAAAYEACKEEKRSAALIWEEAASLAPVIGVSEEQARGYLEVYKPDELKRLAVVAQREELDTKDVIDVDLSLLVDGSYVGREKETVTVGSVHGTLTRLINEELSRVGAQKAVRKEDVNLDTLWANLLAEHEGDEEKAAEEYAKAAEGILVAAKSKGKERPIYKLDVSLVVSVFKLFNYDLEDIQAFVEYVEHNFCLVASGKASDVEREIFSSLLGDFIEENAAGIVLNERSALYMRARTRQIDALVEMEEASPISAAEVKGTKPLGEEGE